MSSVSAHIRLYRPHTVQEKAIKEHLPFCTKPEWGYWWRWWCKLNLVPQLRPMYGDPAIGALPIDAAYPFP
jgi:hypothetical protein